MPNRSCPHCARRLPYAGRRCRHCGWRVDSAEHRRGAGIRWWRRARVWGVALALAVAMVSRFAYLNSTALADWYANFAARYLPGDASSYGPSDSEAGAFFYCARQVARKIDERLSVETFDGTSARTERLGDRRYRVRSLVDVARRSGEQLRHDFVCTVRYERGRWVLEELTLEQLAAR